MFRRIVMLRSTQRLTLRTRLIYPPTVTRSTPIRRPTNRLHASPGQLCLVDGSIVPLDNNCRHTNTIQPTSPARKSMQRGCNAAMQPKGVIRLDNTYAGTGARGLYPH